MELKKNKSEIHLKRNLEKNQHKKEQMNTPEMQITQGKNCLYVQGFFNVCVYMFSIQRTYHLKTDLGKCHVQ